ncbi:Glutathione S-transferase-like protein ustS [Penicillium angulare]|uniref:Glutathione S-transferase-like protein ustS n=1 Tax=Penicillium angulare TaxID=116970 RepID=A0A9W9GCW5_9EURO|nr:Glutathione S-transferase-like protein ustS [Penicillium angulare]
MNYTQSWISYPDVAPLLKALGVKPNEEGNPYTLPAICDKSIASTINPNGIMMDSLSIATHLDKLYPSPPLFPSGDSSLALVETVNKTMGGMAPALRQIVPPKSFGKPLSDMHPTDEKTLQELWDLIESQMSTILNMLKSRPGPFFEGASASYADIVLVSSLAAFHNDDRELWERMMALGEGELKTLWDVCLPWITGQGEEKEWPVDE